MRYTIGTRNMPCTIEVKVRASRPLTMRLQVYDEKKENTFLLDRTAPLAAGVTETYFVQMPLVPALTGITVFDDERGEEADNGSIEVLSIRKRGLPRQMDVSGMSDAKVRSFVRFAQRFAYNAGWLPTNEEGKYYCSDDGQFKIRFMAAIVDGNREVSTPARINKFTQVIEVSKRKFAELSVPERFCILVHEFAHLFMNEDPANELEADLNGLTVYLALGYPRIEAHEVFLKTFYDAPSDANMSRYRHIENFINNFDNYFYSDRKKAA